MAPKPEPEKTITSGGAGTCQEKECTPCGSSCIAKLKQTFPEEPEKAVKIATCESRLKIEEKGDTHLSFWHNGQLLGMSYGLLQVRSGGVNADGSVWSRLLPGETAEQFAYRMYDLDENLKAARQAYDETGGTFKRWSCNKLV